MKLLTLRKNFLMIEPPFASVPIDNMYNLASLSNSNRVDTKTPLIIHKLRRYSNRNPYIMQRKKTEIKFYMIELD